MTKLLFASLIVGALGLLTGPAQASEKLAPLSDVDYQHLSSNPKLTWGRDPFYRSPGFATVPAGEKLTPDQFHLEGIIYDPEDPIAVINGTTFGIGDTVDSLTVEAIAANYVVLKGEKLHFEIALPPAHNSGQRAEILQLPDQGEHQ